MYENVCLDLTEHAIEIINYENTKKMIPLTKEENKIHREEKVYYKCKKGFSTDDNNKKYHKVRDHCHCTGQYRGAGHNTCNLRYKTPKEILVVLHNGSTYDYNIIINELAKNLMNNFNV